SFSISSFHHPHHSGRHSFGISHRLGFRCVSQTLAHVADSLRQKGEWKDDSSAAPEPRTTEFLLENQTSHLRVADQRLRRRQVLQLGDERQSANSICAKRYGKSLQKRRNLSVAYAKWLSATNDPPSIGAR